MNATLSDTPALSAYAGQRQGAAARMGQMMRPLNAWLQARRRYRQTVRELQGLSDRELSDIGVARWQIHAIARQAAKG